MQKFVEKGHVIVNGKRTNQKCFKRPYMFLIREPNFVYFAQTTIHAMFLSVFTIFLLREENMSLSSHLNFGAYFCEKAVLGNK
jgi:hypothetical protein